MAARTELRGFGKGAQKSESDGGLVGHIASQLRESIATGRIPPGSRIVEAQLARQLNISRAPIREAARLLESEGIVVSRSGRGFFVRQITLRDIEEILEVRLLIECECARHAARRFGPKMKADLESCYEQMLDAAAHGRFNDRIAADFEFHRHVVAASQNRMLLRIFDEIAIDLKLALRLLGTVADDETEMATSHRAVIEVLETKNEDAAAARLAAHIRNSWQVAIAQIRRENDLTVLPGRGDRSAVSPQD